jgi:hypothetical protein
LLLQLSALPCYHQQHCSLHRHTHYLGDGKGEGCVIRLLAQFFGVGDSQHPQIKGLGAAALPCVDASLTAPVQVHPSMAVIVMRV